MKTNKKAHNDIYYSSPDEFHESLKTIAQVSEEELSALNEAMKKAEVEQDWIAFNAYQQVKWKFMQRMMLMSLSGCES